jgi:hypothetical protein
MKWLLGAWPIPVAAIAVLGILNSDAVPMTCRGGGPFGRLIYSTCQATLFPDLTGPNPTLVALSWMFVGALIAVGLFGWTAYRTWRSRPDLSLREGWTRRVLLVLPVLPAVGGVMFLMSGDGITHFCPSYPYPLVGYTCLPSIDGSVTGSDPIVVLISWLVVGATAYVGLLGWGLALLVRKPSGEVAT